MRRVPSGPMALPGNGRTNCATHVRTSTRAQTNNSLMRSGEIYLAQFPFGDVPGMKLRPVLLLTGAVGSCRKSWCYLNLIGHTKPTSSVGSRSGPSKTRVPLNESEDSIH